MNIHGKIAVITGASSGLGAALSGALVNKGAIVYGLARNAEKLQGLRDNIGEKFIPVIVDITNHDAINSWVQNTFSNSYTPDILINNAGAGYFSKIDDLPLERWHEMLNTNLNGAIYMIVPIVKLMKVNQNTCHILNIGSVLGKTSRPESAAYSATKYGMQGFSESLFKELRSYKIKVTCVNPGSIETGFFEDSGIRPHKNMLQPKDIAAFVVHLLETPDNFLVDEITMRPLIPTAPE
jgi:NADP-dependent 3-hydroxy acid dehydrogenase YdfG